MRHIIYTGVSLGGRGGELLLISDVYLEHLLPTRREVFFNMLWSGCAGIALTCLLTLPVLIALWLPFVISLAITAPVSMWAFRRWLRLRNTRLNWLRSVEAKHIPLNEK